MTAIKKELPRGIRNNNPGNLDRTGSQWQGLADDQRGEPRFAVFKAPAWGIRASARTLITYYDKYGIDTIRKAISRWAPPSENNTAAYVNQVARAVGVGPDEELDFHDYATLRPMLEAIIRHENDNPIIYGRKPFDNINQWYDDLTIDEGLKLAGVLKPQKVSGEAVAAGTVVVAGGGATVTELVTQVAPALAQVRTANDATAGLPSWVRVVVVLLTIAAVGAGVYMSWRKFKQAKAVS